MSDVIYRVPPASSASRAVARRGVPTLCHEPRNHPVKGGIVVGARGAEGQEILRGLRHEVAVHFQVQIAAGGLQLSVALLAQLAAHFPSGFPDLRHGRRAQGGAGRDGSGTRREGLARPACPWES